MLDIRRRQFITLLGSAAAWPLAGRAQQRERMRRIGVLINLAADDPESPLRVAAFALGLSQLGWTAGRNVQIEYRWGAGDADRIRKYAAELVALAPDVIVGHGSPIVGQLQQLTQTVPIVFVSTADPVGAGLVASFARPGGNTTGFAIFSEFSISAKWLELLKEIAPRVTRAAVLRNPTQLTSGAMLGALQAVAPALGMDLTLIDARNAGEIERAVTAFARSPDGGLVALGITATNIHRHLIMSLASRHRLPAVYPYAYWVRAGGLISYGPDQVDQYRLAAGYVDRILKGEKPADLPVQAPVKYELVINLRTAKGLGFDIPPTVLARADEVIE
jgi:putative tryptophan/tyrosine transport system substrate-binding protein